MTIRTLTAAPALFRDPGSGAIAYGSYEGPLPRVDLEDSTRITRITRGKRWVWLAVVSEEIWLSLAIVRMGYASSAFVFVFDRRAGRMIEDRSLIGPPHAAKVTSNPSASGALARFGWGKSAIAIERRGASLEVRGRLGDLSVEIDLDEPAPRCPPIAAIAALSGADNLSATEKRGLLRAHGSIVVGTQKRFALVEAQGGYDYTQGRMPRNTRWRWAYALGRDASGVPIGFNLTSGFVGEAECVAFRPGRVIPLAEPRFSFERGHPERPWRIEGDGIDLTFDPGAIHAQRTNLLVVRSRFLQPVGTFRGALRIGTEDVAIDGVPGVAEDQDVVW